MIDNLFDVADPNYEVKGTQMTVVQYADANGGTVEQNGQRFNLVIQSPVAITTSLTFIDPATQDEFISFPTHRPH